MKIAVKISISFLVVTIVLTTIVASIFYMVAKDSLEKEIFAHLHTTSQSRKAHIETYLRMAKTSVTQLSKSPVLEALLKTEKDASGYREAFDTAMIRLKRTREANPSIYEFFLLDTTGKVVASSDKSSIGIDKSTDAYFLGGQNDTYIKDAYYSEALKEPLIAVSAPISGSDTGKFLGVLVARIKLADLWKITTERTGLGRTGEIYILNKYGYMITPSRSLKDTFLRHKVDTENFKLCSLHKEEEEEEEEEVIGRDYMGNMVLGTHTYIPEMKWALLTEINTDEAFAPLKVMFFIALIILFLTPIAAWLIGVAVSSGITAPIRRLHRGTEIIATGNLDYKVGTPSKDEIGQLSRAFDTMTEDLRSKIVTIKDLDNEIARRNKAEGALKVSEEKFRALFETSMDAIMMVTPEGGFFDANLATIKLFGCRDKKQFTSLGPADLSPMRQPDGGLSGEKAKEMIAIAMEKGSNFFEWTHKRIDGKEFFATVLLTRMELDTGKVLQATVRDITREKRMNDLMLNTAREWSSTFNTMSEGVSIHSTDFVILNVNSAVCEILGKTKKELIGKKCHQMFHGKEAPIQGCPLEKVRATGEKVHCELFEPFLGRWLAVSVSPVYDEKGALIRFVHVISDITERKSAEARIAEAMEVKNQFTSTVSHELRTPLTAIKEGIGIVLDGSAGQINNDQKDFLELAKRNVDRLSRLINEVLDYQKLEAGKALFHTQKTDMGALIDEVVKVMLPVAKGKNLYLEAHLTPDLPKTILDKDKITQVLINLVNNAIKFTDKGGIVITASKDDDSIVVSVKDMGPGIKKEDVPKLFQGFSQVGGSATRSKGGTGLGLAISKGIIRQHKGEIWVESEEGKGSDFKFKLPVKARYKVLVVDDDKGVLDICKRSLEHEEYEVICLEQGANVLETIQRNAPDMLILDMRLKDINGYEIIGRLRSNKDTATIPILAMSGYPEELGKLEDRREDSALLSIAKPFALNDFLSMIRSLLK